MTEIRKAETSEQIQIAQEIRREVFVKEQGVPEEIEYDGKDEQSIIVLAYNSQEAIGCARLLIEGEKGKIGRVAVKKPFRGKGIGAMLCNELVDLAQKTNVRYIYIHSQATAKEFYEKLGFKVSGEGFYEADKLHYKMERQL